MKTIVVKVIIVAAAILFSATAVSEGSAFAQASQVQNGVNSISTGPQTPFMTSVKSLVNVFLFLIAAVAVVMIIYGGFRYVTSAGESSAVSSAKNTILYAVVGLVIAVSAYAIVNFVIKAFDGTTTDAGVKAGQTAQDAAKDAAGQVQTPPTEQVRGGNIHQ